MLINRERLAQHFTTLCEIDSPSHHEGKVAEYLLKEFKNLGAHSVVTDNSASETGSDTGNLVARFTGSGLSENSIFFSCHMDTVKPAIGVKVDRQGDIFTSRGDTILGSDDKSGIAVLLELMSILSENSILHCPIELIFTTCEEIGLLGAKALDYSQLQSKIGYALDSSSANSIITGAPAINSLEISVSGLAAHSGLDPESGINALAVAATAISKIKLGRLDEQSTANLGLIEGGTATNIVPDLIKIKGEVRSHSPQLLEKHTREISGIFRQVTDSWPQCDNEPEKKASVNIRVEKDFPSMALGEEEPVLTKIRNAAELLDQELSFSIAGGGSDANIFNGHNLKTAILPTGMRKVHTTEEWIDLNDMVKLTALLLTLVRED